MMVVWRDCDVLPHFRLCGSRMATPPGSEMRRGPMRTRPCPWCAGDVVGDVGWPMRTFMSPENEVTAEEKHASLHYKRCVWRIHQGGTVLVARRFPRCPFKMTKYLIGRIKYCSRKTVMKRQLRVGQYTKSCPLDFKLYWLKCKAKCRDVSCLFRGFANQIAHTVRINKWIFRFRNSKNHSQHAITICDLLHTMVKMIGVWTTCVHINPGTANPRYTLQSLSPRWLDTLSASRYLWTQCHSIQ